jgi:signal transduction histidine kinase/ligand-binding sensor domain-containing protein
MRRAQGQWRVIVALGILLASMLAAWSPCAFALDPSLDISQYAHTAWKIRDGFPKAYVCCIAQTPDGYLWLGTDFGLVRFDGIRNVPWPPPDQPLPDNYIRSLIAARDGTLWIGTFRGLASWKDGKLTRYAEFAGVDVRRLLEDHEGTIWAGGGALGRERLCTIQRGSVQCYTDAGDRYRVFGLYEDRKGNLWVGVSSGLWRWKPGSPQFYPLPYELDGVQGLSEDDDGSVLIGTRSGIRRFVAGKFEAYSNRGPLWQFRAMSLLRDRNGGLWSSSDRGLLHVHQGRTDWFTQSDGLSGDKVGTLFEDREGTIWVSTTNGLDRFRELAVANFSSSQGLSNATVTSVLAATDGSLWVGTNGELNRWSHGQMTVYRRHRARTVTGVREIVNTGFPDSGGQSLLQDDRGRIWVSTLDEVGHMENDHFSSLGRFRAGNVHSIIRDTAGDLWIANQNLGLLHLLRGSEFQQIPWARLGHEDYVTAAAADPLQGGLWLGFIRGGVAYFADDQIRASYTAANGLGDGRVHHLRFEPDGVLWAATEGGLSRLNKGHIATLTSKSGLPCDDAYWFIQDDANSYWLNMRCGLVRIARSDLDAWIAAVDRDKDTKQTIQTTVFDLFDGIRNTSVPGGYSPSVTKSSDGKIWFRSPDGFSVVDPKNLPFNKLLPPVHIEQITTDRKIYDATFDTKGTLRLPPLVRDLEIDYTALSLVAPEKVWFRYKLEGWDRDWQDVGNRRQAFYNNLAPRNYRFRVMASNNSGVWNEAGASLDFSIDPAYYQTTWFRLSVVAVFLALLAALYQLRQRQVARQFNLRLEERVAERTRIARDLHDTLLQSFQAVLLRLHTITYLLPDGADKAQETVDSVVEQARQAITEGRDAVQGLRGSTIVSFDLARAISTLGEELAAGQAEERRTEFRVTVEGAPRSLSPLIRDEVYRIASEAVRNAFRHARAARIEVEIRYGQRELRMRVRDNGKGIDPTILRGEGPAGHYGLAGMHERAKLVGGKVDVWSELDSGTEIELTIPASVAYAKPSAAQRSISARRGTRS